MADWKNLLKPATEADLKRTAARKGKTSGDKFVERADFMLGELNKPAEARAKRLWWYKNADGKAVFSPRHGNTPVDFYGTGTSFLLDDEDQVREVIEGMRDEAKTGALDKALDEAGSRNRPGPKTQAPAKKGRAKK